MSDGLEARTDHRGPAIGSIAVIGIVLLMFVLSVGCESESQEFSNPYDPQNPDSPLAYGFSNVTATTNSIGSSDSIDVTVSWDAIPEAISYQVQFTDNGSFETPIFDQTVSSPSVGPITVSTLGVYVGRLRYSALVTYQGESENVWAPWQSIGEFSAADENGDDGSGTDDAPPTAPTESEVFVDVPVRGEFSARGQVISYTFVGDGGTTYALRIEDEWSGIPPEEGGADTSVNVYDEGNGQTVASVGPGVDKVANPVAFSATSAGAGTDVTFTLDIQSDNPGSTYFDLTVIVP